MSDTPQGSDWWKASDGKWYPPQSATPAAPAAGRATPNEAIISLVTGILGIVTCCAWGLPGLVLGVVAVIFGTKARKMIAESNGTLGGAGLAQAGWICGIVAIVLGAIGTLLFIVSLFSDTVTWSVN